MNKSEHLMTIAAEECAEVAQRLSKALRFGMGEVQPGQDLSNAERIRLEFADLKAVLLMIEAREGVTLTYAHRTEIADKKAKVERFLELSKECGTLDD